ncbi:branched-chain amino acid transaminase [Xanthovirga aplysinae]|uniref:branched-chain amino acid transaminase n=1 Tax=Xanthovirga aplysinae TaxID=2529853 RepID=UPI0012BCF2A6|nr:branched-chain amino acid transaminase [Xanthovirga aplysinae]MTI33528.1 branched-chain amino acid transaminase [Xanthovirga aplysinae]
MHLNKQTVLFLDGQWIQAKDARTDLFSQTLHYGNGVFEGLRAYKTPTGITIFKAHQHFERFLSSAHKMLMNCQYSANELVDLSYELLERNQMNDAYIRPLLFNGPELSLNPANKSHLMLTAWEWGSNSVNEPFDVMISSYQKPQPKSLPVDAKVVGHYTNSILASTEARSNGYDEALLLDSRGFIAEGPAANFFFEKNDVLFTPSIGHILPGITRSTIIDLAIEAGYEVIEKAVSVGDVLEADSAFFTSTSTEITGIKSINKKTLPLKWEDSIGYSLFLMYRQKVMNNDCKVYALV